jgi:hypothetical protein
MAAGDAVVKGTNGFTEQPSRSVYNSGTGTSTVRTFEGPLDEAKIATLVASMKVDGADTVETARGWPTIITATFADGNEESAEWTLEPYDLSKELGTHGIFNTSGTSPEAMAMIDAKIKKGDVKNTDWAQMVIDAALAMGEANAYAKLRCQGVDSYLTFGFVLRKVVIVGQSNTVYMQTQATAAEMAGKIISWEAIGVPEDAGINQPSLYLHSVLVGGEWGYVPVNEWLVKPTALRYRRVGRARTRELSQDFIGAVKWSETLYDGGTGSP